MSNFSEKYEKILRDIETNISNQKEKEYVLKKIHEVSSIYMDLIDRVTKLDDTRIDILEERQEKIIGSVSKLKETVDLIKNDIYEEDGYDFEIVCPYCNHEFVADVEAELKEEIECPECHNIIELDWNEEDDDMDEINCEGCSGCNSKISSKSQISKNNERNAIDEFDSKDDLNISEETNDEEDSENIDEDDDM